MSSPESTSDKNQRWKVSTKMAIAIVAINLGILFASTLTKTIPLNISIIAIGFVTFFGMIAISKYQAVGKASEDKDTGHMRTAITGALVTIYITIVVLILGGDLDPDEDKTGLIENFSQVIMVLIIFYFGSKAAKEVAMARKGQ